MKKSVFLLAACLLVSGVFAQTRVDARKLGKVLDSNKDPAAVFETEISLSGASFADDGSLKTPDLAKSRSMVESGIDTTGIGERLSFAGKNLFNVTIAAKDLSQKTKVYSLTRIDGIETAEQYKARKAEEEKRNWKKERLSNLTRQPVQIVLPQSVNVAAGEQAWLPGQLQDKIKSNFQEHLGMRTVVDLKAEKEILKIQRAAESVTHSEETAIEIGKITSAKFAVFSTLRKTSSGYTLNIDFTDLTTGEQLASALSKEYTNSEYLYGTTGAVDELTLRIGEKLGIPVSDVTKTLLASGSADFTVEAQLALAKQNEEAYRRQQSDLDDEIARLSSSTDISAVQNKKKFEAEKALLEEKQSAEKKRLKELAEQKKRAEEDAKLEAKRSFELRKQRDKMANDAAAKAAEVRKLKMAKQGVLGQINVIESKKKALVEIRQGVESRAMELQVQMLKDKASEESRIRGRDYSTVELGDDGKPTAQARQRRENQVARSNEEFAKKFFADCEAVKKATAAQDASLLAEIRADQKSIAGNRTVSSMGDELKVSYGKYDGSRSGWNAYLSLYSDGILLYTDSFIVKYEALSGKKAPDMEKELNDAVIEEYKDNVDMYSSLLTRGDPIIYFEIDYSVTAESDDKPSRYNFTFSNIRVISTASGKVTQTSALNKVQPRTMKPEHDLREFAGVAEKEKARFDPEKYPVEAYMVKGLSLENARKAAAKDMEIARFFTSMGIRMVDVPGKSYSILSTEVTQKLYASIMGSNPSRFSGENNPVECVSWYDAVYFCNRLSEKFGLTPVYSVDGTTDVAKWNYTPHKGDSIRGDVALNTAADGFRLPTNDEWEYAAKGGENHEYSGSDSLDEVGWYWDNTGGRTHPVAQKKANGYGLYDMTGNVREWCWDIYGISERCSCGGGYYDKANRCKVSRRNSYYPNFQDDYLGFRIVRSAE